MVEFRTAAVEQAVGRRLSGYAVRWDDTAAVVEEGRRFDERVQRGAFTRSLQNGPPIILYAHGRSALGSLPVGKLTEIREDDVGLYISVELYDGETFTPVLDAVQGGGLRALSIGFSVVEERQDTSRRPPLRMLIEVDLIEISVVPRGAYPMAKAGVRRRHDELMAERARVALAIERLGTAVEIRAAMRERRRADGDAARARVAERRRQQRLQVIRRNVANNIRRRRHR